MEFNNNYIKIIYNKETLEPPCNHVDQNDIKHNTIIENSVTDAHPHDKEVLNDIIFLLNSHVNHFVSEFPFS